MWSYCMPSFQLLGTAGYLDGLQLDTVNRSICSDAARVFSGIEKMPTKSKTQPCDFIPPWLCRSDTLKEPHVCVKSIDLASIIVSS